LDEASSTLAASPNVSSEERIRTPEHAERIAALACAATSASRRRSDRLGGRSDVQAGGPDRQRARQARRPSGWRHREASRRLLRPMQVTPYRGRTCHRTAAAAYRRTHRRRVELVGVSEL
jgi:hypothetical protein